MNLNFKSWTYKITIQTEIILETLQKQNVL